MEEGSAVAAGGSAPGRPALLCADAPGRGARLHVAPAVAPGVPPSRVAQLLRLLDGEPGVLVRAALARGAPDGLQEHGGSDRSRPARPPLLLPADDLRL